MVPMSPFDLPTFLVFTSIVYDLDKLISRFLLATEYKFKEGRIFLVPLFCDNLEPPFLLP